TIYGRALPLTFAANVIDLRKAASPGEEHHRGTTKEFPGIVKQLQSEPGLWPNNIHLSSYLRGVDGRLPGEIPPKEEPGQEKDKAKEREHLERPEGPSQLDYMPRLALELREHEK